MASSVAGAQGVLFDRLAASSALAGVQVTYGPPDAYEDQEVVALLAVLNPSEEPAAIGIGRKEETYQLEVRIKVHKPEGTAREVNVRGRAIADIVIDEVEGSGDYTLDQTVMWARCEVGTTDGPQPVEGGGWFIFLTVLVTCHARIDRRTA